MTKLHRTDSAEMREREREIPRIDLMTKKVNYYILSQQLIDWMINLFNAMTTTPLPYE